jgi:hypothetical protein
LTKARWGRGIQGISSTREKIHFSLLGPSPSFELRIFDSDRAAQGQEDTGLLRGRRTQGCSGAGGHRAACSGLAALGCCSGLAALGCCSGLAALGCCSGLLLRPGCSGLLLWAAALGCCSGLAALGCCSGLAALGCCSGAGGHRAACSGLAALGCCSGAGGHRAAAQAWLLWAA